MKRAMGKWVLWLGIASGLACDDGNPVPAGTGADGGRLDAGSSAGGGGEISDGGPGGTGGSTATDAASSVSCPATPPQSGSCSPEGLVCEYGDDPRGDTCRTSSACTSGTWALRPTSCPPLPKPDMCPASRDAAQGQACSPTGSYCLYGDLHCECAICAPNAPLCRIAPAQWFCTAPSTQRGCPNAMPNLGTPCATEGAICAYDCNSSIRVCQGGIWVGRLNSCPRSTPRGRRDGSHHAGTEGSERARRGEGW